MGMEEEGVGFDERCARMSWVSCLKHILDVFLGSGIATTLLQMKKRTGGGGEGEGAEWLKARYGRGRGRLMNEHLAHSYIHVSSL